VPSVYAKRGSRITRVMCYLFLLLKEDSQSQDKAAHVDDARRMSRYAVGCVSYTFILSVMIEDLK
jgi:hypothetical protein